MVERFTVRWAALIASGLATAAAADSTDRNVHVEVGQRLAEETNLYRLPAGIDPADLLGPGALRDDRVATSTVALAGQWEQGRQAVVLDTSVAANRFSRNGDLDNTSGRGGLEWRWRLGGKWSGLLGARRERALSSFANTDSLDKDVLDVAARHAAARFEVTPRWRATLSAREAETEHGNTLRSRDDVRTRTAAFGFEHHTPRADSLGLELRRARGTHARREPLAPAAASDYEERRAGLKARYLVASKLLFDGSAGRVERTYPFGARGDFAGDVWSAALRWSVSVKTEITVERWQEVKAHLDAESEHFVAAGRALAASWSPLDSLRIALQASREEQRYIGLVEDALAEPLRHDTPRARSLSVTYSPRERFSLDVSYRRESRGSDRPRFDYSAESLAVGWSLEF